MPEWVADDAVTLAPEHFSNRHLHRPTHLDGTGESVVNIVELKQQQDRGAAQSGRGQCIQFDDLFAEQQLVRPNREFDEQRPPVRQSMTDEFGGAKGLAVEGDRSVRVRDKNVGAQARRSSTS